MTLQELINVFRIDAFDNAQPPLFADSEITYWLNEAQVEAAIRKNLIRENSNPLFTRFEIKSRQMDYPVEPRMIVIEYASLIYKGSDGMLPYVLSITEEEELDMVRPFWRTLPFRPTGIIHRDTTLRTDSLPDTEYVINVEGFRLPLWQMGIEAVTEVLATGTITLTGGTSGQVTSILVDGVEILGSAIAFNTSLNQTAADIVVQINANQRKYTASSVGAVITLSGITASGTTYNGRTVTVTASTITTSTTSFSGGVDAVVTRPEINAAHHRHLINWALYRGYQKPDTETFDPDKSKKSFDKFEEYFGERPDAALRKRNNRSRPHRNTSYA